jgi:hypothetical protein
MGTYGSHPHGHDRATFGIAKYGRASSSMPSYRFYLLDATGSTCDYLVKTCLTDQAARERAASLLPGTCGVEIWRARRLVGRVLPADLEQASGHPGAPWFDQPVSSAAAA